MALRSDQRTWRYGLIGCGRFGHFCLDLLRRMDRVQAVAVADVARSAAEALGEAFKVQACQTPEQLIRQADLDLVHIASPPSSHYDLAWAAIQAGKHVLCEKPLALNHDQASRLVAAANERGVLLAVNHVLRYSPLLQTAKRVIDSGVLGRPLRAFFENYAEDERLPADQWFWDPDVSGGIFIEHGVHFFDLYRWWFGDGRAVWATNLQREQTRQLDRACCTVLYDSGVLGQFYHGFDQAYRLDRADHRVLLERGDIQIVGWVPMELHVHGIVDEAGRHTLDAICDRWQTEVVDQYEPDRQPCHSRGKSYRVAMRARWSWQLPTEQRSEVYQGLFRSLLSDQLDRLDNPAHRPHLTAEDASEAVALGEQATRLARS